MISNDIAMGTPYRDRIEGLFYEPWVGPGFAESELRIFLLGDSHYDSDEKFDHTVTHAVVNLHASADTQERNA